MGLGAYSVVRYADDLSDQRINLGVLLWHPVDGFRCRFSSSVDRVQAIDPRVTVKPIKKQLDDIKDKVTSAPPREKELLVSLCNTFRYGLVISSPYPARISSADETLDRLYDLLVSPVPEIRRASSQRIFEGSLKKTIETSMQTEWPDGRVEQLGSESVKGIPINIGSALEFPVAPHFGTPCLCNRRRELRCSWQARRAVSPPRLRKSPFLGRVRPRCR
jgi:hypothetical protein